MGKSRVRKSIRAHQRQLGDQKPPLEPRVPTTDATAAVERMGALEVPATQGATVSIGHMHVADMSSPPQLQSREDLERAQSVRGRNLSSPSHELGVSLQFADTTNSEALKAAPMPDDHEHGTTAASASVSAAAHKPSVDSAMAEMAERALQQSERRRDPRPLRRRSLDLDLDHEREHREYQDRLDQQQVGPTPTQSGNLQRLAHKGVLRRASTGSAQVPLEDVNAIKRLSDEPVIQDNPMHSPSGIFRSSGSFRTSLSPPMTNQMTLFADNTAAVIDNPDGSAAARDTTVSGYSDTIFEI
jgi:hypothetical protein